MPEEQPRPPEPPKNLSVSNRLRLMLHPKPELARLDTGLRYTDILFGFVIREIFLRLQYWQHLDRYAWLYLSACLALVLGSWIGYRRSLNRSSYEVKFFNLPFFRFLLDQGMLILYFQAVNSRVAAAGKPWTDPTAAVSLGTDPSELARETLTLLVLVFLLYLVWDILGMLMAAAKDAQNKPRYPEVRGNINVSENTIVNNTKTQPTDWAGFKITTTFFVLFLILWVLLKWSLAGWLTPIPAFVFTILFLLAYRTAKETRTSWRQS